MAINGRRASPVVRPTVAYWNKGKTQLPRPQARWDAAIAQTVEAEGEATQATQGPTLTTGGGLHQRRQAPSPPTPLLLPVHPQQNHVEVRPRRLHGSCLTSPRPVRAPRLATQSATADIVSADAHKARRPPCRRTDHESAPCTLLPLVHSPRPAQPVPCPPGIAGFVPAPAPPTHAAVRGPTPEKERSSLPPKILLWD
jgi:hypothetical protein